MKKFWRNKLAVVAFLVFIFILSFVGSVLYWRMIVPPQKISQKEASVVKEEPTPTPKLTLAASLSLIPERQTVKAGQTFLVTINFKTGDYKVDTVDAVLTFDPKILTVEKISEGMFFADYPVKKWEDGKVFLTGTIGAEDKQAGGVKGQGAVGSITFKAKNAGSTTINFDQSSLVAREGENVLGETKGASFEVY